MTSFSPKKLFIATLLILMALNGVVVFGSRLIILERFLQLEQQDTEENLLRVANAVRDAAEDLGVLCGDWAQWDDSYTFIQDGNQEYIRSNLVDATMVDLSMSALLYFNEHKELVFGKAMNLDTEEIIAPPPVLLDYLAHKEDIWPPRQSIELDGLVRFANEVMLLSIRPILTSEGEGPARGLLVMARRFARDEVAELANRTALTLTLRPPEGVWPKMQRDIHLQVSSRDKQNINGDIFVGNLDGGPGLQLAVVMPRDLYRQGARTILVFQLGFLLVSVVFGAILYWLIVRNRARRILSEQQFRQAFEHATDGLLVVDNHKRLALVNPSALQLLGRPDGDLVQLKQACLAQPALLPLIEAGLEGETVGPTELAASPLQGTLQELRAYVTPLAVDGEGPGGVVVTLQDITQDKELEQLKDEFIATVAHELSTPLSVISGYADLLLSKEYESEEELSEFVGLIREKTETLEKIVDDLQQLSRTNAWHNIVLEKEIYDPREHVQQIVASFQRETERHEFVVELPQEAVFIVSDRHRVGQILDNLLSNAVKYSPLGGKIKVSLARHGNEIRFCIADQGSGLTEAQLERVFEKFYRVDNSVTAVRGMGLGLNIAKELVEIHGGRIWLESVPRVGTKAYFTLPAAEQNDESCF